MVANRQLEAEACGCSATLLPDAKHTLSPLEVRTDKALRTNRAMLCFFTM